MDELAHLPPNVAALIARINQKFGALPKDWQYPTYGKLMDEDRELDAQREISVWFRRLHANDWKINDIPLRTLGEK
ncbi:hypothetical protein GCM10027343_16790 [Noviherbaspirillum agri]